jgi:hypothetical protein
MPDRGVAGPAGCVSRRATDGVWASAGPEKRHSTFFTRSPELIGSVCPPSFHNAGKSRVSRSQPIGQRISHRSDKVRLILSAEFVGERHAERVFWLRIR